MEVVKFFFMSFLMASFFGILFLGVPITLLILCLNMQDKQYKSTKNK